MPDGVIGTVVSMVSGSPMACICILLFGKNRSFQQLLCQCACFAYGQFTAAVALPKTHHRRCFLSGNLYTDHSGKSQRAAITDIDHVAKARTDRTAMQRSYRRKLDFGFSCTAKYKVGHFILLDILYINTVYRGVRNVKPLARGYASHSGEKAVSE